MGERLYIGTYTGKGSEGIYSALFVNGQLTLTGVTPAVNPSFLAAQGDILYAVEERAQGAVCSFRMAGQALTPLHQAAAHGEDPCHISVHGGRIFLSNYTSGSLSILDVAEGLFVAPPRVIAHEGRGFDPDRQASAHVHQAMVTPDGKYLAVCDLGMDQVIFYPIWGDGTIGPGEAADLPGGSGPRHGVYPGWAGAVWHVLCELSGEVLTYGGYGKGAILLDRHTLLRPGERGYGGAICLSPHGRHVAATIRGANTVTLFLAGEDGRLKKLSTQDVHGDWPRDCAFAPDGESLLCALEREGAVSVFRLMGDALVFASRTEVPTPTCLLFP